MKSKSLALKPILSILIATSLVACSMGGSGGGGSGGGGNSNLNIQTVATIGSILKSTYNSTCLYKYNNSVFLVNTDGSGTGFDISLENGHATLVSGLPKIDQSHGDACLASYRQLTWVNANNSQVVNIYDPELKQTIVADLSKSDVAGADVYRTSFSATKDNLYANSFFNGSFGFSSFVLPDPLSYTKLDNSLYANRNIFGVVYGFDGAGSEFSQLLPSSGKIPAALVKVKISPEGLPTQTLIPITDLNNQVIDNMISAWNFTEVGNGIIVATGGVQPALHKCILTSANSYQCDKRYSGIELTSQYRIMRLLGGNTNYVYFFGINLFKGNFEVFALKL